MPLSNAAKNKRKNEEAVHTVVRPNPFLQVSGTSPATNQPTQGQTDYPTAPETQPSAPQGPKLLDIINPKPVRDEAEEAQLKRRAKMNAFGKVIGAIGQLGGMAAGGDAVAIQDHVAPFVTNRLQYLDEDYRRRLEQFGQEAFRTGLHNNQLENEQYQAERDMGFRDEQARAAAEEQRRLAAQRAQDAMNQLLAKDRQAQEKEMRQLGVDPNDPKAKEKMLAAYKKKFDADIYSKYKTSGSGSDDKETDQEFLRISRMGRESEIKRVQALLDQENAKDQMDRNPELIKSLDAQLKTLRDIKINKDNQYALDLYEIGKNANRPKPNQPDNSAYVGMEGPLPDTPLTLHGIDSSISIERSIAPSIKKIVDTGDLSEVPNLVQMLVRGGYAQDEEEAIQFIYEAINQ